MKPGRSPDYQLMVAVGELPAGAFIRPIELKYVPKDTLERLNVNENWFDQTTQVVCYTRLGMMVIPRASIKGWT